MGQIRPEPGGGGGDDVVHDRHQVVTTLEISFQQLRVDQGRGEQIVEIVGDTAGQLADRFHLLGLAQLVLGRLALRDVDGGREHRGTALPGNLLGPVLEPYQRAILALPPKFVNRRRRVVPVPRLRDRGHSVAFSRRPQSFDRGQGEHFVRVVVAEQVGESLVGVDQFRALADRDTLIGVFQHAAKLFLRSGAVPARCS